MNLNASLKSFGDRDAKAVILQVPDAAKCLENYSIEIVQYPTFGFTAVFLVKDGETVLSKSFNNHVPNGLKLAFKDLVEQLA